MISIFNTFIHPESKKIITEVLDSTFLSEGETVAQFEQKLTTDLYLCNCVALNSGTSALHLALALANVGKGDEVILPAQTFIATGLVILQQGATPVFADIEHATGNISVESIKKKITAKTKAIMPVHWGGYPCDMDEIGLLAQKSELVVIEDAAHAIGAMYKKRSIGTLSDFTCFSFQAIKHLTTGDGGALCMRRDVDFQNAKSKRWFGINRDHSPINELGERGYNIADIGYKYHMNNYAAALGLANLNGFKERLQKRMAVANYYRNELKKISGIKLFDYKSDRQSAYWLFGFHVEKRLDFVRALKEKGIAASVVHQRIDRNAVFGGIRKDLTQQALFDETQVHIPIHDEIDFEKAAYIVETIKTGW
jgi:perosamine synthetase